MKILRFLSWLLGGCLLFAVLLFSCTSAYAAPWSGSGTNEDPYLINSSTDLKNIRQELINRVDLSGKYFKQTGNIQFAPAESFTAIGSNSRRFTGCYDGGNFIISGINIDITSTDYQALFGYVASGGTVKNVNLVNCIIKGPNHVGGIAGRNEGLIQNCSCTGSQITGTYYVGGVTGSNANSGIVENCMNCSTINGDQQVGGIVGQSNSDLIQKCWNTGATTGKNLKVGGIVGYITNGTIQNCYNTGSISGSTSVGGVAGYNYKGTIKCCYNSGNTHGTTSSAIGGVLGTNDSGAVNNTYFLQTDGINYSLFGIGNPAGYTGAEVKTAGEMQNDYFVFHNLNTACGTITNSGLWSRNMNLNSGYPIIGDNNNRAIYKVSFVNEETNYAAAYNSYTGKVVLPLEPIRDGYIFGGWYSDINSNDIAFTDDTMLDLDLTVYAYWFPDTSTLPAFEMLGAEIRNESPVGLRFKTRLYKNACYRNQKIIEYGTIILPAALIPTGENLTLSTVPSNSDCIRRPNSKVLIIPAINIYTENDDYLIFTGVLTGIPSGNEAKEITARSYVKYLDSNNNEQVVYSDTVTSSVNSASASQ